MEDFAKALERVLLTYSSIHQIQGRPVPIKETTWEYLCIQAADATGIPFMYDEGSHTSGQDMSLMGWTMSCKTSSMKLTDSHVKMSSYRMTKCTTAKQFIHEIDEERKNFDFYLWLVRKESKSNILSYHVYLIPSNMFSASKLIWTQTPQGRNQTWSGWGSTYKMVISASMSNQLWIDVPIRAIKNYQIAMIDMSKCIPKKLMDIADIIYGPSSSSLIRGNVV
jgi:hypothetical protein